MFTKFSFRPSSFEEIQARLDLMSAASCSSWNAVFLPVVIYMPMNLQSRGISFVQRSCVHCNYCTLPCLVLNFQ